MNLITNSPLDSFSTYLYSEYPFGNQYSPITFSNAVAWFSVIFPLLSLSVLTKQLSAGN